MRVVVAVVLTALLVAAGSVRVGAWGLQGHRLVALVATNHLNGKARELVRHLLAPQQLADVAIWADEYRNDVTQTGLWHYVNIPSDASAYDRDRDCPRQPGVSAGSRGDTWRDCIVDRIRYNVERLADPTLDRADRAIALKFVVHFVGDIHQPLHTSAIERGGNGIQITLFGRENCSTDPARTSACNLHGAWDSGMLEHRGLGDEAYVAVLEKIVRDRRLLAHAPGTPEEWAMESLKISNALLLPQRGAVDEAYSARWIPTIDERLATGGVRLAQLINSSIR